MRQMIIAGNWKMNGTVAETESLIGALLKGDSKSDRATVLVCPPFTSLHAASKLLSGRHIRLGAQDMSEYEKGAYTAEVSAESSGLTPIICIGETLEEREADRTEEVVGAQIDGTLAGFSSDDLKKTVIAYEPVWAIGTGRTATPEMAEAVHCFVREKLTAIDPAAAEVVPILYGGSMKPGNAEGLLSQPNIDGGLIGGASLKADDFIAIIKAA